MKKGVKYVEVLVEVTSRKLKKPFCYFIPENMGDIPVGTRVLVPLGKRTVAGYVVRHLDKLTLEDIKPVEKILGESLPQDLLELASWLSNRYLCTLAESLHCVAGSAREKKKMHKGIVPAVDIGYTNLSAKGKQVLMKAYEYPGLSRAELARISGVSMSTVSSMIKKGILKLSDVDNIKIKSFCDRIESTGEYDKKSLTEEQLNAVKSIKKALNKKHYRAFLLHGVTGSGKTEVYLNIVDYVLKKSKQSIVLVPEIALTPQMMYTFCSRFGDQVAILHSRLSAGERYAEWIRIREGKARVILGTRSAVFAPVRELGAIIIDEEHEPTYKQENNPKYHARDVAIKRAKMHNAVVIMGSATPSLESYCRAGIESDGTANLPYTLLTLKNRINKNVLPKSQIIDMRKEPNSIFSRDLLEKVELHLSRGGQIVLFLNRRGYATFVVCRQCGSVAKCPHCDISLTYHTNGMLKCHYCDYREKLLNTCKQCNSAYVSQLGFGTQRVEKEVLKHFPSARVLRMDADTTSKKDSHKKILSDFKDGKADILIGTQMIAKGLDIPKVTLVGVISADTMLYMPDFRAAERTFQLLTQVSGRAGRGKGKGEVIIQTYNPEHYSILFAHNHNYIGFYKKEMAFRRDLKYPPFYYLSRLLFTGKDELDLEIASKGIKDVISHKCCKKDIIITGPAPAVISKIRGLYRWQIVIRGKLFSEVHSITCEALNAWEESEEFKKLKRKLNLSIDVEPQMLI
ncbi:primosomal protein N' [Peptococcaceae bacterium]|nr:primosomal protein N' [Peptococcaceae bacterium]